MINNNCNKNLLYQDVTDITFISSELCNLNCSYCEIAKSSNHEIHALENEKIKQSFLSGDYLTKYKRVFHDYHINREKIEHINLWGQEPTITLNEFASQMPAILDWLPNAKAMFFSTNGVAYIDRIVNLIDVINNYLNNCLDKRCFDFTLQFSLDEIKYNENSRGIDPNIIIKNIKQLIGILNEKEFNEEFHLHLIFHGVITLKLIHSSLENNNVEKLWQEMDAIIKDIVTLNKNNHVHFQSAWGTAIQNPYNATKKEGQELTEFLKRSLTSYEGYQISSLNPHRILGMYSNSVLALHDSVQLLQDIYDLFNYEYDRICNNDIIKRSLGCGVGTHDIKMRYDGTLLYCQNIIFGLTKEELDLHDNDDITYSVQKMQLKNKFSPNLLIDSEETIRKFVERFDSENNNGFSFITSTIINLMYLLLKNNQIDESYQNNPEKILKHAIMLVKLTQCWYNNISQTGSLYGRTLGEIRLYCNGFLDLLEDFVKVGAKNDLWK